VDPVYFGGTENIKIKIFQDRHPKKSGPDRKQNDSDPQHCYAHRSEGYLEWVSAEARVAAAVLARVVDDALGIVATGSRLTQGQHRLLHWHTTLGGERGKVRSLGSIGTRIFH
jgi:hypothetical protein